MDKFWKAISDFFKGLLEFFNTGKIKEDPIITAPPDKPVATVPDTAKPVRLVSGTVRRGMEGEDVTTVQTVLHESGYLTFEQIDGIFQGITEAAVMDYQKDRGLVPDGIVGGKTLAKMGILIKVKPPVINLDNWKKLKEGTLEFYEEILIPGVLLYDPGFSTAINNITKRVFNESQYKSGMKELGFPDYASDGTPAFAFAGFIHNLEASGNFTKNFVNGQPITQVTTIVPKGLGPWPNWKAAFKAGMAFKNITPAKYPDLTGPVMCYLAERFNGMGYAGEATPNDGVNKANDQWSPYIGGMSNISLDKGKYTADSHYDPNAPANGQMGFATGLVELRRIMKQKDNPIPVVDKSLFDGIMEKNPNIDPQMVRQALPWLKSELVTNRDRVMLVNYNINEKHTRSYLIELSPGMLGLCDLTKVAHGSKSDADKDGSPSSFSNVNGSNKSSLGAKVMGSLYDSPKGFLYARHMYGLEKDLNGNDFIRAIKWHTSGYVDDNEGTMIGDSLGCLAQSVVTGKRIKDKLQGILIYVYAEEINGRATPEALIEAA